MTFRASNPWGQTPQPPRGAEPLPRLKALFALVFDKTDDRGCNLRLTSPIASVSDRSAKLVTLNVWLADHSTPTGTTIRGL
ncbi:MAG TPA: hypothetical protein IGS53_23670 [Leptolyngbyaceae cyanobacterium M33_DOE_097]|uniref:Uncharacterized protein n=1 Tax=Oscillatoriales cyanobacterium SpSt-418 TaxID=2282169 RepID=A0A7C3PIS3_9CYAN|nr:hypothetical protein [Leptolyngbyaceae cyanobacterium M33_DOE_097]